MRRAHDLGWRCHFDHTHRSNTTPHKALDGKIGPMVDAGGASEEQLLTDARRGDKCGVRTARRATSGELYAHCYWMLRSIQDAEDALQESLLAAWPGPGRLRWPEHTADLVTTNACLRLSSRRPRRMLSFDHGPAHSDTRDL
jgi:hypothetical protein